MIGNGNIRRRVKVCRHGKKDIGPMIDFLSSRDFLLVCRTGIVDSAGF